MIDRSHPYFSHPTWEWTPQRVKDLRSLLVYSQKRMAILLGCSRVSVVLWEKGEYPPGLAMQVELNRIHAKIAVGAVGTVGTVGTVGAEQELSKSTESMSRAS